MLLDNSHCCPHRNNIAPVTLSPLASSLRTMPALNHRTTAFTQQPHNSWTWRAPWRAPWQALVARSTTSTSTPHTTTASPHHLIVLVNGLFGNPGNWEVVQAKLRTHLDPNNTLLHVSTVNSYTKTFQGIDACAQRLVDEIAHIVVQNPSLRCISFIGHSMGGLLARCAIGRAYNQSTGCVAGLQPRHYVSMATPHLGCDVEGPAQVPLIGWMAAALPGGLASPMQSLVGSVAAPVTSLLLSRSGQQFFLQDGTPTLPPLLFRLATDCNEGPYLSALRAFKTRTAYANCSGDHLVGWANSSLRWPHDLQGLHLSPQLRRRGVVREDPLHAAQGGALHAAQENPLHAAQENPLHAAQGGGGHAVGGERDGGGTVHARDSTDAAGETGAAGQHTASQRMQSSTGVQQPATAPASVVAAAEKQVESTAYVPEMLNALQSMPWRRVDVCFQQATVPMLAHNHIQVTRRWINFEGEQVAEHLAQQLAAMEQLLQQQEEEQGKQPTEEHTAGTVQ